MKYKVIETQDYSEPLKDWAIIAEFDTEAEAQTFAEVHYDTSISDHNYYDPATDCGCESCREGFRAIDYKSLVVQVLTPSTEAWSIWEKHGKSEPTMLAILAQLIADNHDMKNKLQEEGK
jgi:hypothetical protein